MPSAVPNEPAPAPASQSAAKRQAAPASHSSRGSRSAAADFRQELVRHRKPAPKPRDDAKAAKSVTKPAAKPSARSGRGQKPRRPERSDQNEPAADGAAADSAAAESSPEPAAPLATTPSPKREGEPADEGAVREDEASAGAGALVSTPATPSAQTSDADPVAPDAGSRPRTLEVSAAQIPSAENDESDDEDATSAGATATAQEPHASGGSSVEEPVAAVEVKSAPRRRPPADGFGESAPRPARPDASGDARSAPAGGPRPEQVPAFDAALAAVGDAMPQDDASTSAAPAAKAGMIVPDTPSQVGASAFHSGSLQPHVTGNAAAPADDALPPEARFAAANHETIVREMRAEVLPGGGTMRLRLDPPQLGALQVTVQVRDGLVTAAFETSNDEATRLLGHSLNQLKTVLESHGVAVDKLQVQQAPRDERAGTAQDDGSRHRDQPSPDQEHAARQEQQRREMLRKMWRRLSGVPDPLDVTG